MEVLGVSLFANIYRNKRVLITGHTGFKGSWLSLWLTKLGAQVTGVALPPEVKPNHWDLLNLGIEDHRIDIRNFDAIKRVMNEVQPEIVFHLAAQPLVRRSYRDPLETWSTNVMGTANVLEACRHQSSVRAIVAVTTDKCYENKEWPWGYRENDSLGGHDSYSASKACSELVSASYRNTFFNDADAPLLATARAGNVVGGGDWSEDRLIPDLVRSIQLQECLEIRSPSATRPWQHVLESLSGYLVLGQNLLAGKKEFAEAWNFGPEPEGNKTVDEVLNKLQVYLPELVWKISSINQPHEANLLYLDSSKARRNLQWQPVWNINDTLLRTADWYRAWLEADNIISDQQLIDYVNLAKKLKVPWASS
jgi:CDP-glucose 4,6-dehydratase